MTHAGIVLVAVAAAVLAGCTSVEKSVRGWMGETPPATQSETQPEGTVYFSAIDGLPVQAEAARGAQVVGRLALHERVVRTRLESGWAYVQTDRGLAGWVDNAQLIWRLPAPAATTAPEAEQPTSPAPAYTPTSMPEPAATAEPTPQPTAAPTASPTRKGARPEMFDPY